VSRKFANLPLEVLGEDIPGASPHADPDLIAAALAVIPNDDLHWNDWNYVGMATWRATKGAPEGKAAFHAWSKKSLKYNAQITDERWAAYFRSPPTQLGAGTIFWLADQAAPGWRQEYEARKTVGQDTGLLNPPAEEQPPPGGGGGDGGGDGGFPDADLGKGVTLKAFFAYMPMHNYIYAPTRDHWPASSVDARIPPVKLVDRFGKPLLDKKGKPKTMPASAWLDSNK